ncbi:MAG: ABC transporter permease [Acidobacteria bacterium]|nr:ABC transporter permease [Acidobacteriota bacterium]MBI3426363.1 ABC transporter permease [Acidobacteriota bacterium]
MALPDWKHIVRSHLAPLRLPPVREWEIAEELAQHLEAVYEAALLAGATESEAQAQALRMIGAGQLLECELSRAEQPVAVRSLRPSLEKIERRGGIRMETLLQDLRFGVRMLRARPGFTLIAVLTLALGIGANTALFSLLDKLLLQSLPVHDPDALVQFKAESVNPQLTFQEFAWADFLDYRARNAVFTDLTAFRPAKLNLGAGDQMERVRAELVAENYFALLGVQPVLGRTFTPEDNRAPGAHPLALLSYGLWQSRFGGATNVIGQTVPLNEQPYTIIGVMPARFRGVMIDAPTDIWVPAMMVAQVEQKKATNEWLTNHDWTMWQLLGRLKPDVAQGAAQQAMDTLARQVRDAWMPESDRHQPFSEKRIQLEDITEGISSLRGEQGMSLLFLFGIVGVILLIACANLAGLLMARAATRRKEIAVRLALGAGRFRLVRQLLTESLLLAGVGGLLGLFIAPWLLKLLMSFQPRAEVQLDLTLNTRVALYTFGLSLLTGVLFGLWPAWQASYPDLIPALKDEGSMRADGRNFVWSRRVLLVTQIALSVIVLISAGLFVRTLRGYLAIDPGFHVQNVLAADIALPEGKYDDARAKQFFQQLSERLRALPGVQRVAAANYTPLGGMVGLTAVVVEGQPADPNNMPMVDLNIVSAGYHELLGIQLEQGRSFTDTDRKGQPDIVTINAAFANKFFPNQNPIGRRISYGVGKPWLTIIGVTRDIKTMSLDGEARPQIESPIAQLEGAMTSQRVLLRTNADPAALLPQVRRAVHALDAGLALFKATTLEGDLRAQLSSQRMAATLTSVFGLVALLLTAIGLYGVVAYAVNQRTREIGIRMALGAQARDVLRLVLREGAWLIVTGLFIGLAAAYGVARLIEANLYGIRPYDPLTFIAIALLLTAVALVACWIPARRATTVDPLTALRHE